ncbi:hypothetical protein GOV13_02000 [Candidatus Pacearchaeota archaeon]|nr:hypothetical protein [Candidatus Pacearchaeota archaeon]
MFRVATLLEKKGDPPSLDVCIEKQGFESKSDVKTNIGNGTGQTVRGKICFYDERDSKEITFDFAETFLACKRLGESHDEIYNFVRYGEHITIIPSAFVEYFSKRVKPQGDH